MPPDKNEELPDGIKSANQIVDELQARLRNDLEKRLADKEEEVGKLKDQKRMWQGVCLVFITIVFCSFYFNSCKSQDYIDRLSLDAEDGKIALRLMCKISQEKGIVDPDCVNLTDKVEATLLSSSDPVTASVPEPTDELKFMGKGSALTPANENPPQDNLTVEKLIKDNVTILPKEVREQSPIVERVIEEDDESDTIDLDRIKRTNTKIEEEPEAE